MLYYGELSSSFGLVGIVADDERLLAVAMRPEKDEKLARHNLTGREQANPITVEAARQLKEYFAGERRTFDLPISFAGMSDFSVAVLKVLQSVPYGTTVSYGELAVRSGYPGAARAIGRVMAANPVPIVVPCHRVVGAKGQMTGYSGGDGIETKELLLSMEQGEG